MVQDLRDRALGQADVLVPARLGRAAGEEPQAQDPRHVRLRHGNILSKLNMRCVQVSLTARAGVARGDTDSN
jgi:hypothetical protein